MKRQRVIKKLLETENKHIKLASTLTLPSYVEKADVERTTPWLSLVCRVIVEKSKIGYTQFA